MTFERRFAPFAAPYAPPDEPIAARLLKDAAFAPEVEAEIDRLALRLIRGARGEKTPRIGGLEDILREYSLSTEEGVALMVLAEALLRVPDAFTADRLIEEKIGAAGHGAAGHGAAGHGAAGHGATHHAAGGGAAEPLLVSAASWALGATARMLDKGRTAEGVMAAAARRVGMGALRAAARQAMTLMGQHFVFADTIESALRRSASREGARTRYSFDMLGEGARTAEDARRYFDAYAHAIESVGRAGAREGRLGVSVKLSALHPRYLPAARERVLAEIVPRVIELARLAMTHDVDITLDAEEADRLELSLEIVDLALAGAALRDYEGFGVAVQAYQKRAGAAIDHLASLGEAHATRLKVRLVKGAYWDSEVKRAQERGLADYPVFTRKPMTDLNYVACARRLLALRPRLSPQFATHNALTVATIVALGDGAGQGLGHGSGQDPGYELQRLHGMGEELYAALAVARPDLPLRVYAPVGEHENLLAYLVRRLLENGANSSFVAQIGDRDIAPERLIARPQALILEPAQAHSKRLPAPLDLHMPARKLAPGLEFGDRRGVDVLLASLRRTPEALAAERMVSRPAVAAGRPVLSPIDGALVGHVEDTPAELAPVLLARARKGWRAWSRLPVEARAERLERAAARLEAEQPRWLRRLQEEGGKTLDDAVAEWREAIDFLRYYAIEARTAFAPKLLPGPTGEADSLRLESRGVFVCVSPWNFPLAIFLGQVAAALVSGNAVIAKPAEQTPLIGADAVELLHKAGVPHDALILAQGDGALGAALVAAPGVDGVAFTGSDAAARSINRALAEKDGPITPLIAETGGINAMIVDATALPEQVVDDVVMSSFRSAGQRCSALRLLCVQEDVADRILAMAAGAARELRVGDPRDVGVDVGPVIDGEARARLSAHVAQMRGRADVKTVFAGEVEAAAPDGGFYVPPHIFELPSVAALTGEVFGPVLHVVRYRAAGLDALLDAIEALGYGLTLGVHSRVDSTIAAVLGRRLAGNCYVNRNMIGAVVGVQPFGGFRLSGTGPKAGGPHYLPRFAVEQSIAVNTAAVGGDLNLINAAD
ncbi:bifunctional proline dehydrogenase/L-glutamate gamma-semialdehyde dehydrogenase PutA [Methylocella sp.]|uniref:bifunctional proline dehydrogenase/L-glutamate gamma-semialdehyde dehydrogenase PutA n=1 Tax=Methylocella sp. TaxID=1978226 RepID=UPI003782EB73